MKLALTPDVQARIDANVAVAMRHLDAIEMQDIRAYAANLAQDFYQEIPFVDGTQPGRIGPREQAIAFAQHIWQQLGGTGSSLHVRMFDRTVHQTGDPDIIIVEYRGDVHVDDNLVYANQYIALFHVRDGKLTLFREYTNPIPVAEKYHNH